MFKWKDGVEPGDRLRAKEGLAYLGYACDILTIDFGEDLGISVPTNFDLVVMHDHADRDTMAAFDRDPAHVRFQEFFFPLIRREETVRILRDYQGPPSSRGGVRHTAIFRWNPGVTEAQKSEDWEALHGQTEVMPWIRWFECTPDISGDPAYYDWVLEAQFDDVAGCLAYFDHPLHAEVSDRNHRLTRDDTTARVQHRIRMG
jgi:hypothetical protein